MGLLDLFRPTDQPTGLWESSVEKAIKASLHAAQVANSYEDRRKWGQLRDFLDGIHKAHVQAAAAVSHPERSREWAKGSGHAYRYMRLVEMVAERLSVAFHRPPTLYLHAGDGEPLTTDHPVHGPAVQQWEADQEAGELDAVLASLDATVNVLGQAVVSPSWVSDGDYGAIQWIVNDPQEVYVHQSAVAPSKIDLARSVSVEIRRPVDSIGAKPVAYSTWTRTVDDGETSYGHYVHDGNGALKPNGLFGENGVNPYGAVPCVLWQTRKPSSGTIYIPPDEDLIQAQLGLDVGLTDLAYGLRFQAHPQAVVTGQVVGDSQEPTLGPDTLLTLAEGSTFDYKSPPLSVDLVIRALEWLIRVQAVSRSLPPDILTPSAARNLAALQEQRHDLLLRRERVIPFYVRALRKTWVIHRIVGNYWASNGADRIAYSPELQLGVRLAPVKQVSDRWTAAQSSQIEITQGRTSAIEQVMDAEGVDREEATRRVEQRLAESKAIEDAGKPTGAAPGPAKAPGDQPRPAGVERG